VFLCVALWPFGFAKEVPMLGRFSACLALLVLPAVLAAQQGGDSDAPKAIRAVLDAQVVAWNKGDLEGFMVGYWKSPDLTFYSGKTKMRGWQATLERYRKRYQGEGREMGKLAFSELEIEPLGGAYALVRGRWQLTLKGENPGGLFTLVFKKLPEGWRIIHDHTSSS
jgi:beta-aspartyl-peptidase (threonine type)